MLTELKGEIGSATIIVGYFSTQFQYWEDHVDRLSVRKYRTWTTLRPTQLNRYTWNIPPNNRINILLKCTGNTV